MENIAMLEVGAGIGSRWSRSSSRLGLKVAAIAMLSAAGIPKMEATSLLHPKRIHQWWTPTT